MVGEAAERFVFLLVPGFSMMSLASALEPLRSLNRLAGRQAYRWALASLDGAGVEASNGILFPTEPLAEAVPGADYLFVCGGLRIREAGEKRYLSALRQAARQRLAVGAISTGSYLLARAGLLDGYRCTIHWENRSALQEAFPDLACTNKIYEIDRQRMTCSGGTAAMDMMLHLIAERHGADLARGVANQFHHERIRDEREDQRGGLLHTLAHLPDKARRAIRIMQRQIEQPLPLPAIAAQVQVSTRQLERLFRRHAGTSPARYYMQLRVEQARELLLYSDQPIIEVAVACGFTATSHFATWYKRIYGLRPSDVRTTGSPSTKSRQDASENSD